MNAEEKQVIKEVLIAMETHVAIIRNNILYGARIGKGTMKAIESGTSISIDKLRYLIKHKKSY